MKTAPRGWADSGKGPRQEAWAQWEAMGGWGQGRMAPAIWAALPQPPIRSDSPTDLLPERARCLPLLSASGPRGHDGESGGRKTQREDRQPLEVRGQGPTETAHSAHTRSRQPEGREVTLILRQVPAQPTAAPSLGWATG